MGLFGVLTAENPASCCSCCSCSVAFHMLRVTLNSRDFKCKFDPSDYTGHLLFSLVIPLEPLPYNDQRTSDNRTDPQSLEIIEKGVNILRTQE